MVYMRRDSRARSNLSNHRGRVIAKHGVKIPKKVAKPPGAWSYYPNWLYCAWIPQNVSSVRLHTIDEVSEDELARSKSYAPPPPPKK